MNTNSTDHNHVELVGRVSAVLPPRELPSGDEVSSFRLVVRRSRAARRGSKQTVDTFDCDAWTAAARKAVARLDHDDVVRVEGYLRRQFSRGAGGPVSRVTVDVTSVRREPSLRSTA